MRGIPEQPARRGGELPHGRAWHANRLTDSFSRDFILISIKSSEAGRAIAQVTGDKAFFMLVETDSQAGYADRFAGSD